MNIHCTYPTNTRLAYIHEGTAINKVQETHYYPFGHRISPLSNQPINLGTERNNAFLYNGKLERSGNPARAGEFNDDFGLNWGACPVSYGNYGARFYDAQIARWHSVDPLAEKAYSWTPYRYGFNNPILYIDPNGMFETKKKAREHKWDKGIRGRVRKQNDGTYAIHHRGTNGGIRTFNDSEFGITTAYVSTASEQKFSQEGGQSIYGEGGGEIKTIARHNEGPSMDSDPVTSFQPGKWQRPGIEAILAEIVTKITQIYSNINPTEENTNAENSNESADTDAQGQPVNPDRLKEGPGMYDYLYFDTWGKPQEGAVWLSGKKDSIHQLQNRRNRGFLRKVKKVNN